MLGGQCAVQEGLSLRSQALTHNLCARQGCVGSAGSPSLVSGPQVPMAGAWLCLSHKRSFSCT